MLLLILLALPASRSSSSHYSVLGVKSDADATAIKSAYRRAALETHPDRGGSNSDFEAVNEAFAILGDAARRRKYDTEQHFAERDADDSAGSSGFAGRQAVTVPLAVRLRELGGWEPVPLMLALSGLGLSVPHLLRLGVPVAIFLPPGSAGGDHIRVPLPAGGGDLQLELIELKDRRFARRGDNLVADVWLPAWHNRLRLAVRFRTVCNHRISLRRRGERVQAGDTCTLRGYGLPRRAGGQLAGWTSPVDAERGELLVRLHLRTMRDSLVRAVLTIGGATAGATLLVSSMLQEAREREGRGESRSKVRELLSGAVLGSVSAALAVMAGGSR